MGQMRLLVLYVISYKINTDGFLGFGDAGLVFKQRLCADRGTAHLAHVFGSLQYTLRCVTKEIHSMGQTYAKEQCS